MKRGKKIFWILNKNLVYNNLKFKNICIINKAKFKNNTTYKNIIKYIINS